MTRQHSREVDRQAGLTSPAGLDSTEKSALEVQAEACKALGHPIRLFLMGYLDRRGEEVGSTELALLLGISRASFSQHLTKMTAAGRVIPRRAGKQVFVRIASSRIGQAYRRMAQALGE